MEKLIKLEKTEFPQVTNIIVFKYVINHVTLMLTFEVQPLSIEILLYIYILFMRLLSKKKMVISDVNKDSQLSICVSVHKPPAMNNKQIKWSQSEQVTFSEYTINKS